MKFDIGFEPRTWKPFFLNPKYEKVETVSKQLLLDIWNSFSGFNYIFERTIRESAVTLLIMARFTDSEAGDFDLHGAIHPQYKKYFDDLFYFLLVN